VDQMRTNRAFALAASMNLHRQVESSGAPAITLNAAIAMTLQDSGSDEDTIVAGIIFDLLNQQHGLTPEVIKRDCSAKVLAIAQEFVIEHPSYVPGEDYPSWRQIQEIRISRIHDMSPEAQQIMAAAELHHVLNYLERFERFGQKTAEGLPHSLEDLIWYYERLETVLRLGHYGIVTSRVGELLTVLCAAPRPTETT